METLGQRLKRLRIEKGFTQATLAKAATVSQGTVGNIESGIRGYGAQTLLSISNVLGIAPEQLLTPSEGEILDSATLPHSKSDSQPGQSTEPTIAQTLERLGDLLGRADEKTRNDVAALLLRYAQDPSQGQRLAQAIEILLGAPDSPAKPSNPE